MEGLTRFIYGQARAGGLPSALSNLVVAQARHETADFTSNVFRNCKNFFGYKYVGQSGAASCTQAPEGGSYAIYPELAGSVNELIAWIRRRQNDGTFPKDLSTITTAAQYAQLLKGAGYYGDPVAVYAAGLRRFAVNYGAVISFGGVLVAGLVWWYFSRSRR